MDYPASIEMAIWLNQFKSGMISATDATNALETITESVGFKESGEICSWAKLVSEIPDSQVPVYARLPTPGNTYGLDSTTLARFDLNYGVIALNKNQILGFDRNTQFWELIQMQNTLVAPDPKFARTQLQDLIQEAATELASFELAGDRKNIEQVLHQLRPIHLPPALPNRVSQDLALAQRIWLIAEYGITDAQAHGSPSLDQRRIATLRQLKLAALELMAACTANSL